MERDYAFEIATSSIRYGTGATGEVGMDLADRGVRNVMILTDPTDIRKKTFRIWLKEHSPSIV